LVNIGLALKELPKEAGALLVNVNTLPVPYQPKPISLSRIIAIPAVATATGIIIIMALSIQDTAASINAVNSQLDTTTFILEQKQSQKKELLANIETLEKKLAAAETRQNVFTRALESLDSQGDKINGDLVATVDNLVDGIELNSIRHSGSDLVLNGMSPSEVEILQYARNLDASDRFSEVTISNIIRVGEGEAEVVDEDEEVEDEGEDMEGEGEETEGEGEEMEGEDEDMEGEGEGVGGEGESDVNITMNFTLSLRLKG
jgi:Tfp pilus assembly protein PilN